MFKHVSPLEGLDIEKPERSGALRNRLRRQLPFSQQVKLILTYLLCPELVGSTMKVFGELLNRLQIASSGARRVVATLEFFEHPVSELSHNDLLVTLTLSPTSTHPLGRRKCSIRRASGLVQTRFSHTLFRALYLLYDGSCRPTGLEKRTRRLNRLLINAARVPKGRLNLAQDASPGLKHERANSPAGTAEHRSTGFQPSLTGLGPWDSVNPGLTSWAKFKRPFGTLGTAFQGL